ncbi:hypothetical protein D3C71_1881520 [compost metagenome]
MGRFAVRRPIPVGTILGQIGLHDLFFFDGEPFGFVHVVIQVTQYHKGQYERGNGLDQEQPLPVV